MWIKWILMVDADESVGSRRWIHGWMEYLGKEGTAVEKNREVVALVEEPERVGGWMNIRKHIRVDCGN